MAIVRIEALLARHGERFFERCFTPAERMGFAAKKSAALAASVAGRWAVKEAFLKAVGGEIASIPYHDISTVRTAGGAPGLVLLGVAAERLNQRGGQSVHVSISHERDYAVGLVIIES